MNTQTSTKQLLAYTRYPLFNLLIASAVVIPLSAASPLASAASKKFECPVPIKTTRLTPLEGEDQIAIMQVLDQFHCGLATGNVKMIVESYYQDPRFPHIEPYLLTNVPTNHFEHQVWPCYDSQVSSAKAEKIIMGTPIHGLDQARTYQQTVFASGTFSNVASTLQRILVQGSMSSAITTGTHHFTFKANNKRIITQDTAMWNLLKTSTGKWKITAVTFVDKARETNRCSK